MARGSYAPLATAPTTADNRARAASPSNTSAAHVAAQPATRPSPRAGSSLQSFGQQPSPTPARRRTFLLLFALATVLAASAFLRSSSLRPFSLDRPPAARPADAVMSALSQTAGKRSVGYFVNWGIYDRKYLPQQIPAEQLTHVLYSFANVKPEDGTVFLTDSWADQEIHWDGDSWNDTGTNLYGCLKQLNLLKKKHRHLRVLLSIGGWTFSANFVSLGRSAAHRQAFARSAVQLVEDYGFDGLDIDWEYPKNATEAQAYTELLREVREELDRHEARPDGSRACFELTIAAPCGSDTYKLLDIAGMDRYLSFWNLMAYDFAGSWSALTAHQAQLFGPTDEPSVDQAVQWYRSRGVRPDKLVVGMPLYGRSFAQTNGGIGQPFHGVGEGTWEAGMLDYRALPKQGAAIGEDLGRGAGWSYDAAKREWVSFDTPNVVATKARYVRDQGLGGAMFWELDADLRPEDKLAAHALVPIVVSEMGGISFGGPPANCLSYGNSKFDNLRDGL